MSKRITLISYINENEMDKVNNLLMGIKEKLCKVPYGIDDENREKIDNLPYHFTIFATNKENQNRMLEIARNIENSKIQVKVNDVKIMNGNYDSYCLYLLIEENDKIKELQRVFFNEFPKEKYNPDDFTFHMTIHIDKDYEKILKIQEKMKRNFKPFFLEFDTLELYDYPGEIIEKISIK